MIAAYITTLSKYFIPLWMVFYVYESFAVFRMEDEEERSGMYNRQLFFMVLVHLTCFITMYFETNDVTYLFFYAFQQLAMFAFIVLFMILYPDCNRLIIQNTCMLMTIGFIILTRLNMNKAVRQFVISLVALVIALFIPHFIDAMHFLKKLHHIYALIGILGLFVVLILGGITNGSKLSYSLLGVTFQPSELIKIVFVFFMASALYLSADLHEILYVTIVAAVHVLILTASRDLGSALIFFVIYILMLFLATRNFLVLLAGIAGGSAASVVAYHLFSHIQVRVQAWLDPWSVINGNGYQIGQSLFALGRGGLFGLGLFGGAAAKIPYVEQDFIFSSIAEELGLIFAFLIIFVCLSSFLMIMSISMQMRSKFYQLIAFGLGCMYIFQVFLTIGGNVKFIPLTGVTLPLISYGGSSILATLIMFAIVEGLYMIREEPDTPEEIAMREKDDSYLEQPDKSRKSVRSKQRERDLDEAQYRETRQKKRKRRTYQETQWEDLDET